MARKIIAVFEIEDEETPVQATLDYTRDGKNYCKEVFKLKDLPVKMNNNYTGDYQKGVVYGWNGCINKLLQAEL